MKKEEIFKTIVSENSERIRNICRYYNSNTEEQKDMYQEVLVNIWKSLDSFRGDSALNTWVYRVAVNTSLTHTRKAFRHMKLIVSGDTKNLNFMLDASLTLKRLDDGLSVASIQVLFGGAIAFGIAVGLVIWYIKYKPIRDEALQRIKEIEGE